jgi:hypothetical protein
VRTRMHPLQPMSIHTKLESSVIPRIALNNLLPILGCLRLVRKQLGIRIVEGELHPRIQVGLYSVIADDLVYGGIGADEISEGAGSDFEVSAGVGPGA